MIYAILVNQVRNNNKLNKCKMRPNCKNNPRFAATTVCPWETGLATPTPNLTLK